MQVNYFFKYDIMIGMIH